MTSTPTPTPILSDNNTDTLNTFQLTIPNWNEESFATIIDTLKSIKVWMIIISIGIIAVILLKLFSVCKKLYEKHNEIVIKKHNRVTPHL